MHVPYWTGGLTSLGPFGGGAVRARAAEDVVLGHDDLLFGYIDDLPLSIRRLVRHVPAHCVQVFG